MRATVMAAAHRRAAMIAADATAAVLGSSGANGTGVGRAATLGGRSARRAWRSLAALLAAVLTVGLLAGTVLGSGAGGPLYATRIWVEAFNLPKDVLARAQAEVVRLEARLQEARDASVAADGAATEAALDAYSTILVEAAEGTGGDETATAALDIGVSRHVAVLTALVGTAPTQAQAAIKHALSSSTKVLQDLGHPGTSDPGSNGGGGASDPGSNGGGGASDPGSNGGGGGGGGGSPGGTGSPGQPAGPGAGGPDKTPKPKPSHENKEPRPDRTPRNERHDPKASPTHIAPPQRQ